MKVSDVMSRDVLVASPTQSIRDAAKMMAKIDAGVLPVGENDRLVGMITDRDIAIRAVAEGKAPTTKVCDVMSDEVLYCFDDQDLGEVAQNMGDTKVQKHALATQWRALRKPMARAAACQPTVRASASAPEGGRDRGVW